MLKKLIIASNIGGSLETIKHEKTGFYIAMNSDAKIFASVSFQSTERSKLLQVLLL